ncbi:2-polyprenyl-6-methoxyphenol hydroxylase-like FAD-dependent oxidoreductase [Bradyrhizobium sp. F1.13.1]
MQFHLNGFQPGDPEIADPATRIQASGTTGGVPDEVDVLIVGCGPAGLTLAAQLAQFADIKTCIVEQKPDRLLVGQADGIACRTMEMFHAFGFSERVLKEACWGERDHVLEAGRADAGKHRPQRPGAGRRGRFVGIPARHPQPGAHP